VGRGKHNSVLRRSLDALGRAVYRSDWGARLAYAAGLQGRLHVDRPHFENSRVNGSRGLRVAFASDFHAGPLTHPHLFETMVAAIAEFEPDLVFLGGDYVSLNESDIEALLRPLRRLQPPLGVFAVLGNHDLWLEDAAIVDALRGAGVDVLVNESRRLETPLGPVALYGMDEPHCGDPKPPPPSVHGLVLSLVLMHSPLGLRFLDGVGFDVAFCGHTHGGQVALPGGVPVVLPRGSGERRYARGQFVVSDSGARLLTSRGVGMSEVPLRLWAPSEIHLCTFASAAPPGSRYVLRN